ncbi:hypothetical protein SERLADRAFT_450789 [Serpula lacrymans var. lacrymans S7.9]|uniref:NAD(P)-binding protein n=1 Tax=Serpula lacrymans var. lacrymans (strain S7.9) TaxID=578457 RepID=F8P1U0_SERL9|nr:uncharacterized protein SERLADRAFT_450789 [Serpula lacrymans var. lacrymans S7.9]EGO23118.1 hypothetical protein SERLADRAFT_450789 [Serpula lacrymans var. lacrymans S7.9]
MSLSCIVMSPSDYLDFSIAWPGYGSGITLFPSHISILEELLCAEWMTIKFKVRSSHLARLSRTMSTIRVAIVTGAAQGIGRAIALRLADDGFNVVLADLDSKITLMDDAVSEIVRKGRQALSVPTDVSKEEQVEDLVAKTVETFGGLDVMVANAGIASAKSLLDVSEADFDNILSVNVKGVLFCYRHAAKAMINQGKGGRIIGASSIAGKRAARGCCAYNVSKSAVQALTQTAATEFAKHNITVNAYAPGITDTAMIQGASLMLGLDELRVMDLADTMSIGRPVIERTGVPDEIAGVVSFIASKDSSYVTGQTISVDGGIYYG